MSTSPNINELTERLRQTLADHHAEYGDSLTPLPQSPEVVNFTARTMPQEIDSVAICPADNEFMVVATYHQLQHGEQRSYHSQTHSGKLIVLPVSTSFYPAYPGQLAPVCDARSFDHGIYEIHFHPEDPTLLGAATTDGSFHIYRVTKHFDVFARRVIMKLLPLSTTTIAEEDSTGLIPTITSFQWMDATICQNKAHVNEVQSARLIATTTSNQVRLIEIVFPCIRSVFDARLSQALETPKYQSRCIKEHEHIDQVWCAATMTVNDATRDVFVLSGADDSRLYASQLKTTSISKFTSSTHSHMKTH